jgi:hypothetical protein
MPCVFVVVAMVLAANSDGDGVVVFACSVFDSGMMLVVTHINLPPPPPPPPAIPSPLLLARTRESTPSGIALHNQ